jgi:hypothetical protein
MRIIRAALILVAGLPAVASAVNLAEAKALFEKYVALEHAYDPAVAELYSDKAIISSVRIYPDGRERPMQIPVAFYKSLIVQGMPIAKTRGDKSQYLNVEYLLDGEVVRVKTTRYSELKDYESPFVLVIGEDDTKNAIILEEHTVTRP